MGSNPQPHWPHLDPFPRFPVPVDVRVSVLLREAQLLDWNVKLSPLDGAVVGAEREEEGGGGCSSSSSSSLGADVNKNSPFQPVCASSDHSKHYAPHRGRTTLRPLHGDTLVPGASGRGARGRGGEAGSLHCRFFTVQCLCLGVARISYYQVSCLVISIPGSVAPLPSAASSCLSHGACARWLSMQKEKKNNWFWFIIREKETCVETRLEGNISVLLQPPARLRLHLHPSGGSEAASQ